MGHTWVRHNEHGGYWQCPDDLVAEMADQGWEPSEAPAEPNPAVAERLAWEAEQAAQREAAAAAETTKPTRAARRGEPTQE